MRYRRRWQSFTIVTLSLLAMVLVGLLAWVYGKGANADYRHLLLLIVPYILLLGAMGYFICCLPRRIHDLQCRGCGYDLSGLEHEDLRCPECNALWRGKGSAHAEKPVELVPIPTGPPKTRRTID